MSRPEIYMDSHATTPVDPRVLDEMLPYFSTEYGNAASRTHPFGWRAAEGVATARARVARLVRAEPKEILFTSGATEANNKALVGAAQALRYKGDHLVIGATEHPAVIDVATALQERGSRVTVLPVDRYGGIDLEELGRAVTDRTVLVSLMAANNEIGTIHPLAAIGRLCKERGVLFHTDASQAIGKIPIDVQAMGIDMLSISGHKIYGPKGIGALFVRRRNPRVMLEPIMHGGGHERELRPGTLNVPGAVGLGVALDIARTEMTVESQRLRRLRDRLHGTITSKLEAVTLNGDPEDRLPHNLNLSFAYVEGEALLMSLEGIAVSSGSACTSEKRSPSSVLKAIGLPDDLAQTSIRFGLGRFNTEEEVDLVGQAVIAVVTRLREISPLYEAARAGDRKTIQRQ